jgi:gamma-glutamyltranspeptidase/glutathione hydrolase
MTTLAPFATRYAPRGMVCAVDHLAAEAGVAMLRDGGSAADAAVATSAVLAVTTQHMCGMGGDLLAVVKAPGALPRALVATGRAGSGADPDRLRREGHRVIPSHGDIRAVPIPGCVDGWLALHSEHGRLPLAAVLEPARHYAAEGFTASATLVRSAARIMGMPGAQDYQGLARAGTIVRRPGVARALEAIASGGRDAFYLGEFGDGLLELGPEEYDRADLARPNADWVDPVSLDAFGVRLWATPPPTQSYLTLATSWLASGLDLPDDPDDPLFAHLLIEAARQAAHDRPEVLHEGADGAALLAPGRLAPRRAAIDADSVADLSTTFSPGGTIGMCVVDEDRMGISMLNSNAEGFGCGLVVPGVRIFLQNRGLGFSLESGHPAEYGPGRRPPHTLSPCLATNEQGQLSAVLATMGGDSQPLVLSQLLARRLLARQSVGDTVAAGRWTLRAAGPVDGPRSFATWSRRAEVSVHIEGHAPPAWDEGLRRRGHQVERTAAFDHDYGHAHWIEVDGDHLAGASDPRPLGGAAAGL